MNPDHVDKHEGIRRMVELTQRTYQGSHDGPRLLITGAVHGDEFEPIAAIRRLMDRLERGDEDLRLLRGSVTCIPIVNEPAFLRGHRCAEDGKDLARTCPGRPDGSVTEQIAWALSAAIRTADFYIDLHTGGTELSVYPLAGYMLHPDEEILRTQRRMAHAFNLPVVWGTSADLEGRSMSVARDARVPAIYCEYLGRAGCEPAGVDAYEEGCLLVMAEIGMLERPRPARAVKHFVEDRSPRSGHMQVCNPAPFAGYFETAVELGQAVSIGDPLGTVFSLDGQQREVIRAAEAGIVLVLRTFPRVHAGDSVGVIMPQQDDR
jgi:predicted deacylase